MESNNVQSNTKRLVVIALLIAMEIVLTRVLSIQTPQIRLSLGFIPPAVLGMLFGPLYAGIAGAIADILGFTLFVTGPYFPGFTLTGFLTGATYGLFLHRKTPPTGKFPLWRIIVAVFTVTVALQLALDTLWVSMMTGTSYVALLPWRGVRTVIMFPVQLIALRFITGERFRSLI
ncbi:MAG: folate family ECF transporter S component [Defluviitaleaceae bacterium]|nr:folate family ECF transporter S component [Defluviitaleaceae bacterium]MCL2239428.1 folate family ECF transporter S component [Defluviitaleaceae bacterium]